MNLKCILIFALWRVSTSYSLVLRSLPVDIIQFFNLKMLNSSLPIGWNHFCNADVDEEVMTLFPEYSPSSVEILLRTELNETISFSVKELSQLSKFGFDTKKRTLLFVSGISDPQTLNVRANLEYLQQKLKNFNVVVVDFGGNILQLYNTIKRSVQINGFLVSKVLTELKEAGLCMRSIVVVGHSIGANIAALGAEIFADESHGKKLPLLIALDPALMCSETDFYVSPTVCNKVVVIHGENSVFSERKNVGTVDIYPNGDDGRYQPGCSSSICSHMYPLMLFIHSLTEDKEFLAVKCRDWEAFRRGKCNFNDSLRIGIDYDRRIRGKYYTITDKFTQFDCYNDAELLDKDVELIPIPLDEYSNIEPVILK